MADDSRKEELFTRVTSEFTGLISRIALSHEADPGLRRELIQDILLAIWLALPAFRGDASLKTFVASIAQKRCISHVTRRAREPRQVEIPGDMMSAALLPDEVAMRNDLKKQLVESIQLLPLPQREAVVLMLEGFNHSEVAEVLGISVNAATLRCQRAKTALRSMMERRS